MNEIISTLERAKERALAKFPVMAYRPDDADDLTYQAVVALGLKYLGQTLFIFRRARKLKQELEADRKQKHPPGASGRPAFHYIGGVKYNGPPEEQDAPD